MNATNVVLLPGTLCNQSVFADQVQALENIGITCHNIDFANAGSLEEMAAKTLAKIGSETFSIIAFSMGGMVAFELLREVSHRVSSLVLINCNAHADLPGRAESRAQHLLDARKNGLTPLIRNVYMPSYLHRQDPAHQQLIVDMANDLGVEVFSAQLNVLADRPDASALLETVSCPVLIIGGEQDPLCPPTEQKRMHGLIPTSTIKVLPECGHFATLEGANDINNCLINWFKERENA